MVVVIIEDSREHVFWAALPDITWLADWQKWVGQADIFAESTMIRALLHFSQSSLEALIVWLVWAPRTEVLSLCDGNFKDAVPDLHIELCLNLEGAGLLFE